MYEFASKMLGILGPGAEYHFRHCMVGSDDDALRLQQLATWTQGTATGATTKLHEMRAYGQEDLKPFLCQPISVGA